MHPRFKCPEHPWWAATITQQLHMVQHTLPSSGTDSGTTNWTLFAGGVLLGSTVAAGAAYLAVRYANSSGHARVEPRRSSTSFKRRLPASRCAADK